MQGWPWPKLSICHHSSKGPPFYLPFTDFDQLTDICQTGLVRHEHLERYDPNANNDGLWMALFMYWLHHEPLLFPQEIYRLVQGIDEADFDLVVDPDEMSDDEPVHPPPR